METTTINQRIFEVIRNLDMTQTEFASRIGVPKQNLTLWKDDQRTVPDRKVVEIIRRFKEVDARWLITGERLTPVHLKQKDICILCSEKDYFKNKKSPVI